MSIVTKKKADSLLHDEIEDFAERINTLELNMVEAKEFTHLSAEVFAILQNQINELKLVITHIVKGNSQAPAKKEGLYL